MTADGSPCAVAWCLGTRPDYHLHRPASECRPCHAPQDHHAYSPAVDELAALTDALTGPTSLSRAEFLAPGTLANLHALGLRIARAEPMT